MDISPGPIHDTLANRLRQRLALQRRQRRRRLIRQRSLVVTVIGAVGLGLVFTWQAATHEQQALAKRQQRLQRCSIVRPRSAR